MNSYSTFFETVTGFKPYRFQEELFEAYLKNRDVLLKAPTGAGKTWASILPFVFAYKKKVDTPKKLIYSLPLRTLANSLYNMVSNNKVIRDMGLKVSLQTGEFPDDKFFESDIIFTTIDQTLSSILGFPYSLSKRQANINAGAIIGSYLIFDEFHLLDPSRSLTTSLNILKKLKGLSRFCIMTATISDRTIEKINNFLGSVSVILDKKEINSIARFKNKKNIVVRERPMEVNDILQEHKRKTIVICNTVERAQKLYIELKSKKPNVELICIHSRFFKKDRADKERKIMEIFGKDSEPDKEAILISTQVIEVGLDISCDTLHTEISPINSFLQRAGRCARFEGEEGRIFVYDVKENKKGHKSYLPYERELCLNTMRELGKKQILDHSVSDYIVNKVLTEKELKSIESAKSFDFSRIKESWEESDKSRGRELIRDINSTDVVLLKNSGEIHSMYNYEAISIDPNTLINKLKALEEKINNEEESLVGVIEESNIIADSEFTKFQMSEIPIEDIKIYPRVVLNPRYVNYNNEIGLNFLLEAEAMESNLQEAEERVLFGYKKETYEEHIANMIKVYNAVFKNKIQYPLSKLWSKCKFRIPIDELAKFMIIMHDYGKLDKKWQKIARDFQKSKGNYNEEELLAHTDFDPTKDKLPERLPHHSGIGAMVSLAILEDVIPEQSEFENVGRALASAIMKHHATTTHRVNPYQIENKGVTLISKMIKNYAPSFYLSTTSEVMKKWDSSEDLSGYMTDFSNPDESFLYFILVRILRLCDQKSMEDKYVSK